MTVLTRPLAIVTAASSGVGFELAKYCAQHRFDLLITSDEPQIHGAVARLRTLGAAVEGIEADLATTEGVERLYAATKGRPVAALLANAGGELGESFLDQEFDQARRVIDTNVTGTLHLIQKAGRDMRRVGEGRIAIVGSIANLTSGTRKAVHHGTNALLASFADALRAELQDSGVTVTWYVPGTTGDEVPERAPVSDAKVRARPRPLPDELARMAFEAMMRGDGDVVARREVSPARSPQPRHPGPSGMSFRANSS